MWWIGEWRHGNTQQKTDCDNDGDGDKEQLSVIEKAERILKQRKDGVYNYDHFMTYECQQNVRKTMERVMAVFDEKLEAVVDEMDIFSQAYERVATENKNLRKWS